MRMKYAGERSRTAGTENNNKKECIRCEKDRKYVHNVTLECVKILHLIIL
jgi:hypothetical protein